MLTLTLDPGAERPLYEQIYRQIRQEIASGGLPAGARLPSKRALAAHLKVSVVTVEGAYGQLLAEGYLRSEPKRGFFVWMPEEVPLSAPGPTPSVPPDRTAAAPLPYDFSTSAVDTAHFPFSTWARLMREVLSQEDSALLDSPPPQGVPELRRAIVRYLAVDTAHFPFSTWARLMREVLSQEDSALLDSPPPQGVPELRRAIVRYLRAFRGIRAEPEQVVVGAGAEYLTSLLLQLLGHSGGWAVEDPGYRKAPRIFTHAGALVCPIPLDGQGLRVDALRWSGARVAHITPSHHFPLGTVMPIARRQALLRWAMEGEDRYLIEDDYDSEFRFDGRPIPALQTLDSGERVIYLNTFAKSLAPSLRIGYMVLPPHLLERYRSEFLFYASTVPSFEQHTLARFLEGDHFERHIRRMRTIYRQRRDALLAAARAAGLLELGHFSGTEAGLHLLFHAPGGPSEDELVRSAAQAGVGLYPLSDYCLTPPDPGRSPTLILGYGGVEADAMAPAMVRLAAAWRPLFPGAVTSTPGIP